MGFICWFILDLFVAKSTSLCCLNIKVHVKETENSGLADKMDDASP